MNSPALYGPVQDDLRLVDDALDRISRVENFPALTDMLAIVLGATGKRLRPAIALLGGTFGEYQAERLVPLAASIELLHTATLVHDDVIDRADTRRGRATANSIWDNGPTVMLGDYMFAHAAELVATTGDIRVIRLFAATLMKLASGEINQDLSAFDSRETLKNYFSRIGGKTASLFAAAGEGGAIVSGAPEDQIEAMREYSYNLGMAFQIVDDILDFSGDEAQMGKPVGSDLMQGTLTLPSLLLIERSPVNNPVQTLFERRDDGDLQTAITAVRESSILDESHDIARGFRDRASDALAGLPPTAARDTLADLLQYVVTRSS
ncbi:MAG: polyprenyl synthetase family protein [Dehalococcoidia bacterium]|nr:polyprenyl synthetase family protein [Dehalococcoidia bacterium]